MIGDIVAFDQFTGAANSVARYAGVLRDKLMEEGFTRREAVTIVSEWLQVTMRQVLK